VFARSGWSVKTGWAGVVVAGAPRFAESRKTCPELSRSWIPGVPLIAHGVDRPFWIAKVPNRLPAAPSHRMSWVESSLGTHAPVTFGVGVGAGVGDGVGLGAGVGDGDGDAETVAEGEAVGTHRAPPLQWRTLPQRRAARAGRIGARTTVVRTTARR
jgi:hypothetical protein